MQRMRGNMPRSQKRNSVKQKARGVSTYWPPLGVGVFVKGVLVLLWTALGSLFRTTRHARIMQDINQIPEHVYVNLTASAGAFVSQTSMLPVATATDLRNTPIVVNTAYYSLAVIRCVLSGSRTLPLWIPSIDTTQTNPWKTNYAMNALAVQWAPTGPSLSPPGPYTFFVRLKGAGAAWLPVLVDTSAPGVPLAQLVQSALQGIDTNFTASTVNGGTQLAIHHATLDFQVCLDTSTGVTSVELAASASCFGFWYLPQSTFGGDFCLTSSATSLTLPNPFGYATPVMTQVPVTQTLMWTPQTLGLPTPPSPLGGQQVNLAYFCYEYQFFVNFFNRAMQAMWNSLASSAAAGALGLDEGAPPILAYSGSTKCFTLYMDPALVLGLNRPRGAASLGNGLVSSTVVQLGLNRMLQDLMCLPAASYDTYGNATLDFTNAPVVEPGFALGALTRFAALTNDFSPVASLWSPVDSIVLTSTRFNARQEVSSAPALIGADTAGFGAINSVNYTTSNILTDIVVVLSDAADYRKEITAYVPTGELRYIDLGECAPPGLMSTDMGLAWKSTSGEIVPITLNPNASMSCKVVLRRKF